MRDSWRDLIGVKGANDDLPAPGQRLRRDDNSEAFGSDFSDLATAKAVGNIAVIGRLKVVVLAAARVRVEDRCVPRGSR